MPRTASQGENFQRRFYYHRLAALGGGTIGAFCRQWVDMEVILYAVRVGACGSDSSDIDYQAGVGPASAYRDIAGFQTRAIWFPPIRSLLVDGQAAIQNSRKLKGKKVSVTGLGGTVHIAFNMALENSA